MIAIRSHYDGRVFVPDGPVDLPANVDLLLHVHRLGKTSQRHMTAKEVGASALVGLWRDMWPGQDSSNIARRLRDEAQTRGGRQ